MEGGGVHRLRGLDRRGRLVAVVCGLLLLVPVGASVVRATSAGWRPSNDDALIVLQARDVLGGDPPLVGQPSTSARYADGLTVRHPGAIEFYLLAVPIRVLGSSLGTLLTAAALAGGSVLLTAWVAFRRGGPAVGLGAAVLLAGAMWSSGTAVLSDPISSNVGGYPLIAGTALAWALWCDDRRLWPVAVAVWSFTIQQHLAIFGIAGIVAAWGVAGAAATTWRHRRAAGRLASSAGWAAAAVAVGVACWLPPLIDQVAGTGNLGRLLELSGHSDRPAIGWARGLRVVGRAISVPPVLVTRWLADDDVAGLELIGPLSVGQVLGVVAGALALVGAVVVAVRRRHDGPEGAARAALAATALVVVLGGAATAANLPDSLEASRINLYRWMWAAAVAVWGLIAWSFAGPVLDALRARRAVPRSGPLVVASLAVVALAVTATAGRDAFGDSRRDEGIFAFEDEALTALEDQLPEGRPVRVSNDGRSGGLLGRAGHRRGPGGGRLRRAGERGRGAGLRRSPGARRPPVTRWRWW